MIIIHLVDIHAVLLSFYTMINCKHFMNLPINNAIKLQHNYSWEQGLSFSCVRSLAAAM